MNTNYVTITHLTQTTTDADCFVAYHPELPTVRSQGETPQEARGNLAEATELALEHLAEYGLPVPEAMILNEGITVQL
jgi:predicted RNase H-like HicB family nuclease